MIPSSFSYTKANSVEDALAALSSESKLLAGGHSLIPAMKLRLNQPGKLIDIGQIPSLKGISETDGHLLIGACTTHSEIARSSLVQDKCPVLAQAADMIGDIQVRNRGTIGGSMAHADPAADWPAVLIAVDARVELKSQAGSRSVDASDFFTGFYETALEENELIVSIEVPVKENRKMSYTKFEQPASRFAIVGCAVTYDDNGGKFQNVRVAFTGVSENAFRDKHVESVLEGNSISPETVANAAARAAQNVSILSDHYASEDYRKHIATVYCKRAFAQTL